jgi:hypothetical protein
MVANPISHFDFRIGDKTDLKTLPASGATLETWSSITPRKLTCFGGQPAVDRRAAVLDRFQRDALSAPVLG